MILHIPHSSRKLDGHIKLVNEKANLDYLTDTDTDILFDGYCIKFHLSRFVCDVERFEHNEPMDTKGQGIIYRKDIFSNDIERLTPDDIIYDMYKQHHRKLTLAVNKQLAYYENIVIVDCHSFTSKNNNDPDVCIGTNDHTPIELVNIICEHFKLYNINTKINKPYSGTIVPKIHENNYNVKSVMIEINKKIYINNINEIKPIIIKLMEKISDYEWSIA